MGKHGAENIGVDLMDALNKAAPKNDKPYMYSVDEFADIFADFVRDSLKETYTGDYVHIEDAMAHVSMVTNAAFLTVNHFYR